MTQSEGAPGVNDAGSALRGPPRWQALSGRAILVLLVVAVYWPTARFGYVAYDDNWYGSDNAHVQQGLTAASVQWAMTARVAMNWHPLTWLSLMLDVTLFGDRPEPHHVVNVALHAVNVLLLLSVLHAMTGMFWRSALVAGLLAVHPIHVESVAWISERKDVLSMLFWLLTMQAYRWYARDAGIGRYLLVTLFMILGLMSKPMVVSLPFVLLLLDFWPLRRMGAADLSRRFARSFGGLLLEKAPLIAVAVVCMLVTRIVQHGDGTLTEGRWMTLGEHLRMIAVGYMAYPSKMLWPDNLAALYPNLALLGQQQWSDGQVVIAAMGLAAVTLMALVLARRVPWLVTGWLWYLGAMVPVIGFVQVGRQAMADRYAYIPFIGLYIIVAWGLGAVLDRVRSRLAVHCGAAAIVAAVIVLAAIAHRQVWVWKDSVTLFSLALDVTENNWMMLNNLAGVLVQQGKRDEALPLLDAATSICRECSWVHEHNGETLAAAGRLVEAQRAFERAIALNPLSASAHSNLGVVLVHLGSAASGFAALKRAVEIEPGRATWRKSLAIGLALDGRPDEARAVIDQAIQQHPEMRPELQPILEAILSGDTLHSP